MLIQGMDSRHTGPSPKRSAHFAFCRLALCGGLLLAAGLAGCSGDTADNSQNAPKFEVADDADTPPSASAPAESASPIASTPEIPAGQTAGKPNRLIAQPPANPGTTLEGYKTPDGSIDELFAFMESIDSRSPQGNSEQEQLADFIRMQQAIAAAADKVAANPQATDEHKLLAAQRKVVALSSQEEVGVKGARKELLAYCQTLASHAHPEVREMGRLVALDRSVMELLESEDIKPADVLAQFNQALAELDANESVFEVTRGVANQLDAAGLNEEAAQVYQAIAVKFADHANPQIRRAVAALVMQSRMGQLNFREKAYAVISGAPDAVAPFMETVQQLFATEKPSEMLLDVAHQSTQFLEFSNNYPESQQVIAWTEAALAQANDPALEAPWIELAKRRLSLVGKPLPLEGSIALDGQPFDWQSYRGKLVLVDFWASWCGPCIAEFPEMKKQYEAFRDQGFEIVGINLDDTAEQGQEFLDLQPLPWRTVVSSDPSKQGMKNPVAEFAGIEAIPFIVLVDTKGIVRDLHVRGPRLAEKLNQIFGPPPGAAGDGAAPAEAGTPAAPAVPEGASIRKVQRAGTSFVSLFDEPASSTEANAAEPKPAAESPENREFGEVQLPEIDQSINPYAPDPGLSKLELAQFLLDMRDKPQSIQRRPGFSAGVLQACDRLIELTAGEGRFYEVAVLEKLRTLHGLASFGDAQADAALQAFVATLDGADREKIAAEVAFLKLERRVIETADSEEAKVDDLLAELKGFYAEQKLEEKHLRMASSTVKAINKIEDDAQREKLFQEFGKLFAASKNKELSKYGKQIGKSEGQSSDLVGKPLDLEGLTAAGVPLDWASYRGKPVIVDFWATWCGPCRAAMPNLQQTYELHKDAGLEVVGISLDQDQEALAEYLAEQNIVWSTVVGEEAQSLATKYGVRGIPTMMLVDAQGNVVAVAHNVEGLMPKLKELLAKPADAT